MQKKKIIIRKSRTKNTKKRGQEEEKEEGKTKNMAAGMRITASEGKYPGRLSEISEGRGRGWEGTAGEREEGGRGKLEERVKEKGEKDEAEEGRKMREEREERGMMIGEGKKEERK